MLSALTLGIKLYCAKKTPKGLKETFGDGRCVHYLNCGDGSQLQTCVQIQQIIYIKLAVKKNTSYTSMKL